MSTTVIASRAAQSFRKSIFVSSTVSHEILLRNNSSCITKRVHYGTNNNICNRNLKNRFNISTASKLTTSTLKEEIVAVDSTVVLKSEDNTEKVNDDNKTNTTIAYLDLAKARLSSLVVVTTGVGFVAAGPVGLDSTSVLVSCLVGTALCSSSAAAFNQIIERERDKKMKRTQLKRPLVTGQLSVQAASTAACIWGIAGPTLLYVGTDPVTASLGAANIVLYSGVYTAMKPYSIYNTWVGAVVGAIPPVMGWTAATAAAAKTSTALAAPSQTTAGVTVAATTAVVGSAIDQNLIQLISLVDTNVPAILLASTLYFWQLPHFMALSFMHRTDYKRGGFAMLPCLDEVRTSNVIVRYTWYLSTIPFLATLTHTTSSMFAMEGLALNSYALYVAYKFKYEQSNNNARHVFLTSLWYLPCLLMLFLLHSKTFEEDIGNKDKSNDFLLSQKVSDYILAMRKRGRELCVHETAIVDSPQPVSTKESCPIVFGTKAINETSSSIKNEIVLLEDETKNPKIN